MGQVIAHKPIGNVRWHDGEFGYCAELVFRQGNSSVPKHMVRNYLALQASQAFRDKEVRIGEALTEASNHIAAGYWGEANRVLSAAKEFLA